MKERLEEKIREYERKKDWQESQALIKREILAGFLNRYDKGEVKYELVERCSKDLAIYNDLLNNTIKVLEDLTYIKESE